MESLESVEKVGGGGGSSSSYEDYFSVGHRNGLLWVFFSNVKLMG